MHYKDEQSLNQAQNKDKVGVTMIEPTEFRFNNKNRRKGDTKTRIVNAVYKGKNIFIVDQMMNVSNVSMATTVKWESKM